ncbi:hypothetical protein ENBRE01_2404 [Enteropsectra breve]|nr:hypothetical protein ENBRE01_2404 [Enteropsectra breve]
MHSFHLKLSIIFLLEGPSMSTTRFNDLPHNIKQKIINIRNKSNFKDLEIGTHQIKDTGSMSVPSSKDISDKLAGICAVLNSTNERIDVSESLRKEIKELKEFVEAYNANINNKDVFGEIAGMIDMFEQRYKELARK